MLDPCNAKLRSNHRLVPHSENPRHNGDTAQKQKYSHGKTSHLGIERKSYQLGSSLPTVAQQGKWSPFSLLGTAIATHYAILARKSLGLGEYRRLDGQTRPDINP